MKALRESLIKTAAIKMTGFVDLDKLQVQSRLEWFGHVQRRENDYALKSTDHVSAPEKRPAVKPKNAGLIVKRDLNTLGLKSTGCLDRIAWKDVLSSNTKENLNATHMNYCLHTFRMSNHTTIGKRTKNALVVKGLSVPLISLPVDLLSKH